jgi:predicted NUDIX family NTP pyrophosphohydrolase
VNGHFQELKPLKQPGGKIIYAWALEGEIDPASVKSNTFTMEWPPHSGVQKEFPEIDKGEWFGIQAAYKKILPGQKEFLDQLQHLTGFHRKLPS